MSSHNPIPEGTVTLLSTDLAGSTLLNQSLGDEASAAIEREIKTLALKSISKNDGIPIKDTGDGLMVAFRSARRAITCARELQCEIQNRNRMHPGQSVRLRIGLHTGEVLSENGDSRGETVIITKRIEEVAPAGGIFASETVYGVLGTTRKDLEDRGLFNLKGINAPWHLYEVPWVESEAGEILPRNELTPFVGRSDELSRLIIFIEKAKKASGSLLLLGGEAGVGKSRLALEGAAEARRSGLLVLLGHCMEMENAPPYLPTIEQIEQAARIVPPEAMREALGENAPEVAKLLPDLRKRFSDILDPVALPPEQERRYLMHGVCQYIERAARVQPMFLIFEDLHWADESTLLLFQHLTQRLHEIPVLVVGTYRHNEVRPRSPLASALPSLLRQRHAEEMILNRFKKDTVCSLLEGRAGKQPPRELLSLFMSETEGNPFFVEELFHHLCESGKLFNDDGHFKSEIHISDTEVPRGVRLLISQRLQNVSEVCHKILTNAAALGHNFDFNLLSALADLDEDTLLDALDEAADANIIKDISSGREVRYLFVNEQIRQTLLAELSTPRRQRLHSRIAKSMEQLHGEYAEKYAAEIAHHLYQAGALADGTRTARYLLLAGEKARTASAFDEAVQMFDAAETVLPSEDMTTLGNILYFKGMALRGTGQMEKALQSFQQSIELFSPGNDQDRSIQAKAQLLLDLYRGHDAVHDLERLLARSKETGNKAQELESLLCLGRAYYIISLNESGGGERALDCYEKAYKLAQEIGDKGGMAKALIPTNHLVDYWPHFREKAVSNIKEAARLAQEIGDEGLIIDSTQVRLRFLSPGEAHKRVDNFLEKVRERRDPLRLKELYFFLMWHLRRVGEFNRCVEACNKGIELADELGANPVQYPTIKALALINLGQYGEAWDSLQSEVVEERFGYAMQQFGLMLYMFDLLAFEQAAEQARKTAELGRELDRAWMRRIAQAVRIISLARLGSLEDTTFRDVEHDLQSFGARLGRAAQAEVMLMKGSLEKALELAESACQNAKRSGIKLEWIPALELKARILSGLKRMDHALSTLDGGIIQAQETNYRPVLWRMYTGRSKIRETLGDKNGAKEDLRLAESIVNELADTIPDQDLRQSYKSSPLMYPILRFLDGREE